MNLNEQQANWLIQGGHVSPAVIQECWPRLLEHSDKDLCALLVWLGHLNTDQADYVRSQVQPIPGLGTTIASETRSASSSSDRSGASREHGFTHPDYEVIRELGRGGMGVVYLGRQKIHHGDVVIKCLLDASRDMDLVERFQREARILAQFRHENIVTVNDFGFQDGQPYIVMSRIDGIDLGQFVREGLKLRGELPDIHWTLLTLVALGRGLEECHKKGIVHRDLKPANVMIETDSERPILIDFGVAHVRKADSDANAFSSIAEGLTKTGVTVGTPAYMAPEQLDGGGRKNSISTKADVWSFGGILYYCLTGQAPYTGDTDFAIYKQLIERDPTAPSRVNASVPKWLDEICLKTMTRDPDQRPDMGELIDLLVTRLYPKKHPAKGPAVLAFVALFFAVTLAYFLNRAPVDTTPPTRPKALSATDHEVIELSRKAVKIYTKEVSVAVQLSAVDENLKVIFAQEIRGSKRFRAREDGEDRFTLRFDVKRGQSEFEVFAVDEIGNLSQGLRVTIVKDEKKARVLSFQVPEKLSGDPKSNAVTVILKGTLDESHCEVSYQGQKAHIEDRQFTLPMRFEGRVKAPTLTVKDRVGLLSEVRVPLSIVSRAGGRTHGTLGLALAQSKANDCIYVRPGDYRETLTLNRSVRVLHSGERGEARIRANKKTLIAVSNENPNFSASFEGLTFSHEAGAKNSLLTMLEGELSFKKCKLEARGLIALCGPDESKVAEAKGATLNFDGSQLIRHSAYGVVGRKTKVVVTDCEILDKNPQPSSGWYGAANSNDPFYHRGAFVIRKGSSLLLKNTAFRRTQHHHVFLYDSQFKIDGCEFGFSYESSVYFGAEVAGRLLNCRFQEAQDAAVQVTSKREIQIDNCHVSNGGEKFFKDVSEGGTSEGASPGILVRDGARLSIMNSSVKNYAGDGLFVEDNDNGRSSVVVRNSEFSGNRGCGLKVQKGSLKANHCRVSENKGDGVSIYDGADLRFVGGRIQRNKGVGVRLERRAKATLIGVEIKGNKGGVQKIEKGSTLRVEGAQSK